MTMHATAAVTARAPARPRAVSGGRSAATLGGTKIVSTANVRIICGSVVLVACIFAVLYLATTNNNDLTAVGLIGTIICSVLLGTFGLVRLDRIEQRQAQLPAQVQQTVEQVVEDRLSATGQLPLRGRDLASRDD